MKKVAIGCLIILGLLVVAVGGGVTWVYFKVSGMVEQVAERAEEIQSIQDQAPSNPGFEAPQDGLISDQQVSQLVAVERYIQREMQPVLDKHKARVEELKALAEDGGDPSAELGQMFNLFEHLDELADLVTSYKRIQVDALNQENFAYEEYTWARTTAIRSISDIRGQLDLEQLEQFDVGEFKELSRNTEVKPENTEKLAEHRELLAETLPWLIIDMMVMGIAKEANAS